MWHAMSGRAAKCPRLPGREGPGGVISYECSAGKKCSAMAGGAKRPGRRVAGSLAIQFCLLCGLVFCCVACHTNHVSDPRHVPGPDRFTKEEILALADVAREAESEKRRQHKVGR